MRIFRLVWSSMALCWCIGLGGLAAAESPGRDAPVAPLHDGLGEVHFAITTNSDVAQKYFDQGFRLGYAFWWSEARRSFEEAIRQDPDAPMPYWGKAWAYGPYLNNGDPPERDLETAYEAIQEALKRKSRGTALEQALIEAMSARYFRDPKSPRPALDQAYYEAMRPLADRFPTSSDAITLAAASYMNTTRWDYWTKDGKPKANTPWLVATLEKGLALNGRHSGNIHYYIHAVEASDNPDRAVPYARTLASTMPGAAHLVHMGSHILIQTGNYDQADDLNLEAQMVDELFIGQPDQEGRYPLGSYHHNVHFAWSAASFEGRSAVALQTSRKLHEKIYLQRTRDDIKKSSMVQLYASLSYFAMVRFGHWDEMLKAPAPDEDIYFERAMWHYGRGIAFLGKNDVASAQHELSALQAIAQRPDIPGMGRVSANDMLQLASKTLEGEILAKKTDYEGAIAALKEAVSIQVNLSYTEPPPWYYPVRQSLGAVLLEAGKPAEAEAVYEADLKKWRENGWSLFGLLQSLRAQGKTREAESVEKRFQKAWVRADVTLTASRF